MSDFKKIWHDLKEKSETSDQNVPFGILKEQAKAISEVFNEYGLRATIVTSKGEEPGELIHALYLLTNSGHGYNYRYIEFSQPIEGFYPVKISAFQTGDCDFGKASSEEEVYGVLEEIFNDPRTHIVFDQLKSIGRTISEWENSRKIA